MNLHDFLNQKSKDEDQASLMHKFLAANIAPHHHKSQATNMILNLCKPSVSLHCQPWLRQKTAWQIDGPRKCKTNPVTKKYCEPYSIEFTANNLQQWRDVKSHYSLYISYLNIWSFRHYNNLLWFWKPRFSSWLSIPDFSVRHDV
jgi:hypothetical protein